MLPSQFAKLRDRAGRCGNRVAVLIELALTIAFADEAESISLTKSP